MDNFIYYALAAGIGIALPAGALGCFIVWRRLAYFSDSLSHSALLGIALGLLYDISTNTGLFIVCFLFAVALVWLQQKKLLAMDTLLGILAHLSLSAGVVIISLMGKTHSINLHAYLFGDILTVQITTVYWIYASAALVLALLIWRWHSLVLMTLHEGLARAEGMRPFYSQLLLMFLMTVFVVMSVRIVGFLLITSLLIIPAATARQFARSPETMAAAASTLGIAAVIAGIAASMHFDTPTGPSIVMASAALFFLTLGLPFAKLKKTDGKLSGGEETPQAVKVDVKGA